MPCYPNAKGLLCMIVYQCYKQTYYDEGTEILEKAELTVISICNESNLILNPLKLLLNILIYCLDQIVENQFILPLLYVVEMGYQRYN